MREQQQQSSSFEGFLDSSSVARDRLAVGKANDRTQQSIQLLAANLNEERERRTQLEAELGALRREREQEGQAHRQGMTRNEQILEEELARARQDVLDMRNQLRGAEERCESVVTDLDRLTGAVAGEALIQNGRQSLRSASQSSRSAPHLSVSRSRSPPRGGGGMDHARDMRGRPPVSAHARTANIGEARMAREMDASSRSLVSRIEDAMQSTRPIGRGGKEHEAMMQRGPYRRPDTWGPT